MSKDKRVLGKVGMALLLVFFYAPILFMIILVFTIFNNWVSSKKVHY